MVISMLALWRKGTSCWHYHSLLYYIYGKDDDNDDDYGDNFDDDNNNYDVDDDDGGDHFDDDDNNNDWSIILLWLIHEPATLSHLWDQTSQATPFSSHAQYVYSL